MSTNPFRRRAVAVSEDGTTANPQITAQSTAGNDGVSIRSNKAKTGKSVRIISPVVTRSNTIDAEIGEEGSSTPASVDDLQLKSEYLTNAHGNLSRSPPLQSHSLDVDLCHTGDEETTGFIAETNVNRQGVPGNPFKKTLATLDGGQIYGQPIESTLPKPEYDVESFGRLLLTGQRASEPIDEAHNVDTQSSNITANVLKSTHSRPKSSQTVASASDLTRGTKPRAEAGSGQPASYILEDEEPQGASSNQAVGRVPQTVSFENPALSFDPNSGPNYGLEKHFAPITTAAASEKVEDVQKYIYENQSEFPMTFKPVRKDAPTPPPTRRSGRSKSSIKTSNMPISEAKDIISGDSTSYDAKPPPPPPRRSGLRRHGSSSSVQTGTSISACSDLSTAPTQSMATSSVQEHSSFAKNQSMSTQSGFDVATQPPPPPPPPRRRASSQSNSARLRYESLPHSRSNSRSSSISQQLGASPVPLVNRHDPLTDIAALQKEVDELKGKVG